MEYLDKVPNHAIFDETIEIAKQRGHDGIRRLVTGVLHNIQRNGLPSLDKITDEKKRISIEYSVPMWIEDQLTEQIGKDKAVEIFKTINQPASQSIRVNTKWISDEGLAEKLRDEGYEVEASKVAAHAFVIKGRPAAKSALFADGFFTIQDESAMLPVQSMDIKEDDYILDACAAPGGKTTQIAEYLTTGKVEALDLHGKKLRIIRANADRMGLEDVVDTHSLDARKVSEKFADNTFDKILVDAPCSGLGLLRRKPEIRYDKTLEDVNHLAKIQLEILNAVVPTLKVGGQLVFSTCTILNQENSDNVTKFLKENPNFEPIRVETAKTLKPDRDTPYLRVYPDDYDSDGFFISGFKKIK